MSTPPPQDVQRPAFEAELVAALPQVRGYVAALTARGPGSQETEDLLQDLAAKALRYQHAYDEGRALLPWLRQAALHLVLDARRAAGRRPHHLESEPEDPQLAPGEHSARRDELQHLLQRLAPLPRRILLSFHRDGQSIAAIARALELPDGTVKSHLHRARERLRRGAGARSAPVTHQAPPP